MTEEQRSTVVPGMGAGRGRSEGAGRGGQWAAAVVAGSGSWPPRSVCPLPGPTAQLAEGSGQRGGVGPRLARAHCGAGLPSPPPASICQHLDFKVTRRPQSEGYSGFSSSCQPQALFMFPLVRPLKSPVEPSFTHHLGSLGRQARSHQRPCSRIQHQQCIR